MVRIRLAELLGQKKWSRTDLSKMTGIRYNTVNDYYNEFALSIKLEHIKMICDALGCSSSDLIEYTPNNN